MDVVSNKIPDCVYVSLLDSRLPKKSIELFATPLEGVTDRS